ncbi:DUF647 family protein [Cavenderia fasciculata]|uniref:DUF647 family protein n=1 Tax=Cavenderia fasciculata TaxID=261658 RepID=F4Q0F9_CACFS|nr:DUF647 family protein [Cavenderia fasciculata]EGG18310.1 DUF647 family protein [Cavenderia fasciculata]|eukprot:XP_004357133.1 DUF647 family protein [Cavenderia fasciculata]
MNITESLECNTIINRLHVTTTTKDEQTNVKITKQTRKHGSFIEVLRDMFLPKGYPNSVTSDYTGYQTWDTLQALCSSLTGVLATRAILKGYGVGNLNASVASASIQWITRDAAGMLGRIIFAWKWGTDLDCNSKTWRFAADLLNDFGMTLEMISPLFGPSYFLPISCLGLISKSICGVAGGCTKASLTQHFAKRDNLADVSAKDGSQETAIALVGMLLGMVMAASIPDDDDSIQVYFKTWLFFIIFTVIHLLCNYRAVSLVQLTSINRYRANLIYQHFNENNNNQIPTPKQISLKENILFRQSDLSIELGVSFTDINGDLKRVSGSDKDDKYMIWSNNKQKKNHLIKIAISSTATSSDIIEGYFESITLVHGHSKLPSDFIQQLSNGGWCLDRMLLNTSGWRYTIDR